MLLKIFAIVCFATLLAFVHSDGDDLLTLNCYSCLSSDQEPTTASCSQTNCTDLAAGDSPAQYAVCVKTKIQYGELDESSIYYQASCEYQLLTLQDQKYCEDLVITDVPGMKFLECKSCRSDLCNSY